MGRIRGCRNCHYFHSGDCQRFPPQVTSISITRKAGTWDKEDFFDPSVETYHFFPKMRADDWCGEWKLESLDEED